jgi:mycothiol synthase
MTVVDLAELGDPDRALLAELLARAAAADGHPPLPEPQMLALTRPRETRAAGRIVLAREVGGLAGGAFLSPARDGSTVLHVVVDPAARQAGRDSAISGALIRRALSETPPGAPIHLWAMHAGPDDDELAAEHGFVPERDLLQMRVPLPLARDVVTATRPLATRPFAPGRDEGLWVETNNRAFAGHPEQSAWSVEQLRERMAADWVDLDGFLVADDPAGAGIIGSCWTKVDRAHTPALGEIYVISVDPDHHGQGWGRSLTVAGLESLARRGITVGMLYTDATNESAVALYRSLGFHVDHIDRSYRRGAPVPA